MKIGRDVLNVDDPFCEQLLTQYQGLPRAHLLHHESIIGDLQLAVYFKPSDDLLVVPVEITTDEIDKLLLLEVLHFLDLFNCLDRVCVKEGFRSFVETWWSINQSRFCKSFLPLARGPIENEQTVMRRIHALLNTGAC
ncbi:hypothetical protein HN670_00185 [bacterium]|nr:hypothetical protein [bacterium]